LRPGDGAVFVFAGASWLLRVAAAAGGTAPARSAGARFDTGAGVDAAVVLDVGFDVDVDVDVGFGVGFDVGLDPGFDPGRASASRADAP
jgi:hypothetical protein